jgi:hypothetical protein
VFSKRTDNFDGYGISQSRHISGTRGRNLVSIQIKLTSQGAGSKENALVGHQSCQKRFEMSHRWDTWVQYEEALFDHFLSAEEDQRDLERMSALRYEGNIEDYIT